MSLLSVNKKGKWVVGGVIAFALIATASTGLAAWIVGTQTGANTNGNISLSKHSLWKMDKSNWILILGLLAISIIIPTVLVIML